jgi:hypothetical protein
MKYHSQIDKLRCALHLILRGQMKMILRVFIVKWYWRKMMAGYGISARGRNVGV